MQLQNTGPFLKQCVFGVKWIKEQRLHYIALVSVYFVAQLARQWTWVDLGVGGEGKFVEGNRLIRLILVQSPQGCSCVVGMEQGYTRALFD